MSLVLDAHETAGGPVVDAAAVRVGLPQDSRQRHARRAGRLVELQPQAVVRPIGPVRRSGRGPMWRARAGATSTGNARRSSHSTPTPISACTTSSSRCRTGRRGAKTTCWPCFRPKAKPTSPPHTRHRLGRGERQGRRRSTRRAARPAGPRSSPGRHVAGPRRGPGPVAELAGPTGRLAAHERLPAHRRLHLEGRRHGWRRISVEFRQATLTAEPLIVASPWLNINEPRLDVALAGSWNQVAAAAANRAGQPDLRDGGDPGEQRRPGHAR